MRIEIKGGVGALSVSGFQTDFSNYIKKSENIVLAFKAIKKDTYGINGGATSLQKTVEQIEKRIQNETEKIENALKVKRKADDFIVFAKRIDAEVSKSVKKNKSEFYEKYPHLKPVEPQKEAIYKQVLKGVCSFGEKIADGAKKIVKGIESVVDWTKDTLAKAKKAIVEFWNEHWEDIINWGVTILCAVGSVVAIALAPFTGGASILFIAGISALSGAIVAGTRNVTSQFANGANWSTLDWGSVGKDALIAGIIGGVTGAIGAGLGGAITSGLSNTGIGSALLSNSSTAVRMATGFVIGSTSEVASGAVTRGAGEVVESYLTTGEVDFDEVVDAMFDPQQMVMDAAIGGTTGVKNAYKTPTPASKPQYSDVNDIPESEFECISKYNTDSSSFNDLVRAGDSTSDTRKLSNMIAERSLDDNKTLYRKASLKDLDGLNVNNLDDLVNQEYSFKGFMSTTADVKLANNVSSQNVLFEFSAPAGSNALDLSDLYFNEVIFDSPRCRIDGIQQTSGGMIKIFATIITKR